MYRYIPDLANYYYLRYILNDDLLQLYEDGIFQVLNNNLNFIISSDKHQPIDNKLDDDIMDNFPQFQLSINNGTNKDDWLYKLINYHLSKEILRNTTLCIDDNSKVKLINSIHTIMMKYLYQIKDSELSKTTIDGISMQMNYYVSQLISCYFLNGNTIKMDDKVLLKVLNEYMPTLINHYSLHHLVADANKRFKQNFNFESKLYYEEYAVLQERNRVIDRCLKELVGNKDYQRYLNRELKNNEKAEYIGRLKNCLYKVIDRNNDYFSGEDFYFKLRTLINIILYKKKYYANQKQVVDDNLIYMEEDVILERINACAHNLIYGDQQELHETKKEERKRKLVFLFRILLLCLGFCTLDFLLKNSYLSEEYLKVLSTIKDNIFEYCSPILARVGNFISRFGIKFSMPEHLENANL